MSEYDTINHYKYEIEIDGYMRYCESINDIYDKLRLRYSAVKKIMNNPSYIHPKYPRDRHLKIRKCDFKAYPDVEFMWSYEGSVVNRDMYMW